MANGQRVEFWKDRWCGDLSLGESFPALVSIATANGIKLRRGSCEKVFKYSKPMVMLQETKRVIWDRRCVNSVWKSRSLEWAALPACGASGGDCDFVGFN